MFAGIMEGMASQDAKTTTNRIEAAKLFNEHIKNQSDLGIEVTEQSLSDAWNSNSGGVMQRHAPTQQRLQGIVTAQNKALAEKDRAASFKAAVDQRTLYGYVETDINKALDLNRFSKTPMNNADLYDSLTGQYPVGSLQLQELQNQTRSGNNLTDMQSFRDNEALSEASLELGKQLAQGYNDPKNLKSLFPSLSLSQIEAYIARYNEDRAQVTKGWDQADVIYEEGRTTFKNQQVTFKRKEEEAILAAAQKVVADTYQNKFNNLTLVEKNAAIEKAKEDIIRLVIEQEQDDLEFAQDQYTFHADVTKSILTAADLVTTRAATNASTAVDDGQQIIDNTVTNAATARSVSLQPAQDLRDAKIDINSNYKTATIESVTADLARWGLTDPAIITQTWDQVRAKQEEFDLTGMTTHNAAREQKLIKSTSSNQKRVADLKAATNATLQANFVNKNLPDNVGPPINAAGQRYIIDSLTAQKVAKHVNEQVAKGAWAELSQPEITEALFIFLQEQNVPTYANELAKLESVSRGLVGADQYTPAAFKDQYIPALQRDAEYAIAMMEQASQSNNLAAYTQGKGMLALLLSQTQQDLVIRKKDQQKAFGTRASQAEVMEVTTELEELMLMLTNSSKAIAAPVEAVKVINNLDYNESIFTPDSGSSARIDSIDKAVAYLENQTSGKFYNQKDDLINFKAEFAKLTEDYELAKKDLAAATAAGNVNEEIRLDNLIADNLGKIFDIQYDVRQIIRRVIADSQ